MSKQGKPILSKYQEIREELPDGCLLLYRLGDFWEMFEEDAEGAAGILGIALSYPWNDGIPVAGIFYHDQVVRTPFNSGFIKDLLDAGWDVATFDSSKEDLQIHRHSEMQ